MQVKKRVKDMKPDRLRKTKAEYIYIAVTIKFYFFLAIKTAKIPDGKIGDGYEWKL